MTDPAGHLVPLPSGDWRMWRTMGLRGTGFPAGQVLDLAAPGAAGAADRLLEARTGAAAARAAALDALRAELDALRAAGAWDDTARRRPLLRAISRLNKGGLPGPEFAALPAVAALAAAEERVAAAEHDLDKVFAEDLAQLSAVLDRTAADPRFREAVIWQNRKAYADGVRKVGGDGRRNSRRREHEALVAGYLQRYTVKNDSIGFFGPVGWAEAVPEGAPLTVTPGASLVARREVYFEQWCLDALVRSLGTGPELRRWFPPRRLPTAALEGTALRLPGRTVELPAAKAAVLRSVLALCDGGRTGVEVAAELGLGEAEGLALLESLRTTGLIAWDLELPVQPRPEVRLREQLERIGDPALRADALARLGRLTAARDRVAAAAGRPDELDRALADLETVFTELTGTAATRAHGETYGARTLVYEDCRRDGRVEVGPDLLTELGRPLSLMLDSARWLTARVAEAYREEFRQAYDRLLAERPDAEPRLTDIWARIQSAVLGPDQRIIDRAVAELQERWGGVFGPLEGRRVTFASERLRPLVDRAFAAAAPGWPGARYQAPDVMIAATGPEAVAAGDYQLVMGELHVGVNTLRNLLFVDQHPDPEALERATLADMPVPRVRPVLPKEWLYSTRTTTRLFTDRDHHLLLGDEGSWLTGHPRALNAAEVRIGLRDGRVVARAGADGPEFDLVELLAEAIGFKVVSRFQPMTARRHTPRVTVDKLVVCRESWRFHPAELAFAREKDEAARFTAARAWAREHGIPRFVFVKAAHETKPFYVDLDSPLFVNAFAHVVRGAPEQPDGSLTISVGEMLPTTEQTWLKDRQGQSYTSEFRVIAVDK
ncbi:lantibiotic dehydratase [Streptomyces albidoflavus]|uniref:lantibiotic dehydratase n=1 Tax=Streptomyces albidoflavus TaxID=1886 RepID=UPI000FF738C3|nr:lantibiotic dehydratase [Streptomyces albidoflavus]RWZ77832.1 lantibiotic dehydratase [Streptomyces albidoflavus]